MEKEMRTPVIAGNWKMNKTPYEAVTLVNELKEFIKNPRCEVVICPPFLDIPVLFSELNGSSIKMGAQNCHFEEKGAFTGEVSVKMLKESGCSHVIIGHSERRQYFNETDETVNLKIKAAVNGNLTAIVCVGETLEERESEKTEEVIKRQVEGALKDIDELSLRKIIIAYEPIWAIGTGKTAQAAEADVVCGYIRELIAKKYTKQLARTTRILYGGSMNSANAKELLEQYNIDGGLIGGASLKARNFAEIVSAADSL